MQADIAEPQTNELDILAIQKALRSEGFDGWLFYYFHDNDPLALRILKLHTNHVVSRRWFYFIPVSGKPTKLVHRIEMESLDSLPGDKIVYMGWRELEEKLSNLLKGYKQIAMQYSPRNAVPYISRVDAGIIELVKSNNVEVVSSANLIQQFEATWCETQLSGHIEAANVLRSIVFEAFNEVRRSVNARERITEFDLQQFILQRFDQHGLTTSSPPIVAVNEHASSPHYQPTAEFHSEIKQDDLLLLDIWAKKAEPFDSVYADITWTGYVGDKVPTKYSEIFDIVRGARDAALNFVKDAHRTDKELHGWQVDDVARNYISQRGFGEYFVHRTGHSIGIEVHGNGANIDNLETREERRLIPRTAFSIEPGIYLSKFGIRSEIDVYLSENDVLVAGQPIQTEIIPILSV